MFDITFHFGFKLMCSKRLVSGALDERLWSLIQSPCHAFRTSLGLSSLLGVGTGAENSGPGPIQVQRIRSGPDLNLIQYVKTFGPFRYKEICFVEYSTPTGVLKSYKAYN